jgi:hypothetical protein
METLIRSVIEVAARMGAATSIGDCARRLMAASLGAIAIGVLMVASVGCAAASLWIFSIPRLGPRRAAHLAQFEAQTKSASFERSTCLSAGRRNAPIQGR